MVSTKHENADFYFDRDVDCLHTFFSRRFNYVVVESVSLNEIDCKVRFYQLILNFRLDNEVKASGFIRKELNNNVNELDILENYEDLKNDKIEGSSEEDN